MKQTKRLLSVPIDFVTSLPTEGRKQGGEEGRKEGRKKGTEYRPEWTLKSRVLVYQFPGSSRYLFTTTCTTSSVGMDHSLLR